MRENRQQSYQSEIVSVLSDRCRIDAIVSEESMTEMQSADKRRSEASRNNGDARPVVVEHSHACRR